MALSFFVTIDGSTQGKIKGETSQKGREGKIMGVAFSYDVNRARDPGTGAATGPLVHEPVRMTRQCGFASPLLYMALFSDEPLTSVRFEFFRASSSGAEELFQTITLGDARIVGISQSLELNLVAEKLKLPSLEEVSFDFQRIEIQSSETKVVAAVGGDGPIPIGDVPLPARVRRGLD